MTLVSPSGDENVQPGLVSPLWHLHPDQLLPTVYTELAEYPMYMGAYRPGD
jgi:hypothetical protein